MNGEVKLKSCPFCGSAAKIWNRTPTKRPRWEVSCASPSCTANIGGGLGSPKKDAIAVWNRRVPDPQTVMLSNDDLAQDMAECIFTCNWESIDEIKTYIVSFLNDVESKKSGTSVIRWTRYDGTPETLPDDGKLILHKPFDRLRICIFHHELDGEENRISSTFAASVSWRMMLGDLWAYLPEPPEGM